MIKIAIAGDFALTKDVMSHEENNYNEEILGDTKKLFEKYDYRIINLECPVTSDYYTPIIKCGPSLSCNENAIDILSRCNFNCATLANNHFLDYGEKGIKKTILTLERNHIDHVGGGLDLEDASKTLYKEINGESLAIINCCEHEFSIATTYSGGSNPVNPIRQYYAIIEAHKHADHVIVITHGGIEGYDKPTPRMQELFRFFIEAGADAVVNHHQHCPSGYEIYKGKPIFYGLGNFCFYKPCYKNDPWNKGYVVCITFENDDIRFQLHPYYQSNGQLGITYLQGDEKNRFLTMIDQINTIIAQPNEIIKYHVKYMDDTSSNHSFLFTPYRSKLAKILCNKGYFPLIFPKSKWPILLNKIECESHQERIIHFIKKKIYS